MRWCQNQKCKRPVSQGKGKYCSRKCRPDAISLTRKYGLTSGTAGALSELVVCADLVRKGYAVFRAISPSCTCDLIAMKEDQLRRIEVRSTFRLANGELSKREKEHDKGKSDTFALVNDAEVIYEPPLN